MRFTLSSTTLSSHLSTLSKVITNKNAIAILECFLFEVRDGQLIITASDSENVMKATCQLDETDGNGSFAVSSQTILDAVRELPEQPLSFDVDTDKLVVKVYYQNGMYNFTVQNAEEYPQTQPLPTNVTRITFDSGVLLANISRTLFATASEELRPVMNGIYFDITPEFTAIVASDGSKLVRNRNFSVRGEGNASFILPKKPATLLKSVLSKDGGDVVIQFNDRNAMINFADGVLICRLIEGRYPNYNSVIPQDNPNQIRIGRKTLISTLRRVMPFASESSQLVKFVVTQGKIEVSSEDIDFATSAKEEITCEYEGMNMSIGFKGSSLSEILTNLEGEEVIVELADPSRAGVVVPAEQPDQEEVLMLIMPMLLNE
ncbi:MAG: DNA polymerase III subunit beta [Prevotella sp.]|jgi:DNA polymerase-3 subunit beta|nr:DNA polymerase III subunit beta [Prevotella sp.]MBR3087944.1 DNA polymerase III subunit beta [Prevotella sp.]